MQLQQAAKSQLIDFACHIKTRDARGKPSHLYSRDSALALLKITSNFKGKWTQENTIDQVTRAFDWVEVNADTNPARALKVQHETELVGKEGEHGIEDTIHEKVSKVIAAKHETERKAAELHRAENTLKALASLLESCGEQKVAKEGYDQHRANFSRELAVLRNVVVEAPIPGVPAVPPEFVPEIARSMVMQDGKWYLPDRVMADFTGEPASNVNLRAGERNGLELVHASKSQVVDFACNSFVLGAKRGPSGSLYSRDSALALLKITTNFKGKWTQENTIDQVTRAFDWVEVNADTNPARALKGRHEAELVGA